MLSLNRSIVKWEKVVFRMASLIIHSEIEREDTSRPLDYLILEKILVILGLSEPLPGNDVRCGVDTSFTSQLQRSFNETLIFLTLFAFEF